MDWSGSRFGKIFLRRIPLRLGAPGEGKDAFSLAGSYSGPSYPTRRIFGGRLGRMIFGGSDFILIVEVGLAFDLVK